MSTDKKISNLVSRQLPEFVRAEHPTFVAFLQAYYEYLEQSNSTLKFGKTIERAKNLTNYFDVDRINESGLEEFNEKLFSQFMSSIPEEALADRSKLIKHIKDFYRAGGTEKSYNLLFRILFGEEAEYYYPKTDILFTSSGKWLIEKSIRLTNTKYNGTSNNSIDTLQKFKSTIIKGNTSLASAKVERVQFGYENNIFYREFFLSGLEGDFLLDEEVFSVNVDGDILTANVLSGYVSSITVTNSGTGYVVGTDVPLLSNTGNGAVATISAVTQGNVPTVFVINGGAGFRANDFVFFANPTGFTGTRANAKVVSVVKDVYHPNTYILCTNVISEVANTQLNLYSNTGGDPNLTGNVNTSVLYTLTHYEFSNSGEASVILVNDPGEGYSSVPIANVIGNSAIRSLGIIGKLKVTSPGTGYSNGDIVTFRNVTGGYGSGANAQLVVNSTGSIIRANLVPMVEGYLAGGTGYNQNYLPKLELPTGGSRSGGSLEVETLLGFGDILDPLTGAIGQIISIRVDAVGSRYETPPTVDLTGSGSGNATAYANIATGILTSPGRYIDDTGKISSSSFLQDRDYYQRYSYVTKVKRALSEYKKHILDLLHPAGTKLWAEYLYDVDPDQNVDLLSTNTNISLISTYTANSLQYNANSVIYRTTPLQRIANTPNGAISFWFNPDNLSNDQIIFAISDEKSLANSPKFEVKLVGSNNNNNIVKIVGRNSDNTILISMSTNTRNKITKNTWNNLLATWDIANTSNCKIYLNEINSTNVEPNIIYTGNSYNTNIQSTGANGIFFKPDGTRMYITKAPYEIIEYSLANSWNIQSATFVGNTSRTATTEKIRDIFWRNDGRRLYVLSGTELFDSSPKTLTSYSTQDAWNIRSISIESGSANVTNIRSVGLGTKGIYFSDDGKNLYVTSYVTGNKHLVIQYELSRPWDQSSLSSFSVNSEITIIPPVINRFLSPTGITFSSDGKKTYITQPNSKIHLFTLNTAWNIQTMSYDRSYDLGDHINLVEGLYYNEANDRIYIVGSNTRTNYGDSVREYTTKLSNTLINDRIDNANLNLIVYNSSNVTVSGTASQNNPVSGCLSEIWFTDNHINLANSTIRNRFFNNFNPGLAALQEDLSVVSLLDVTKGGAGFQVGDYINVQDPVGFTGRRANAIVISVNKEGIIHPNSYLLCVNTISEQETTQIGLYSNNLNGNANTSLANTLTYFVYGNTGPVTQVQIIDRGQDYNAVPTANVIGNTSIKNLGIIGKVSVTSPGINYANGEVIRFRNVTGGYGFGANAVVVVDSLGEIKRVELVQYRDGYIIGGTGYKEGYFPQAEIVTSSGTGGIVQVDSLLGSGDELFVVVSDYSFGTGFAPIVYLKSPPETANINSGIGGNFDYANNIIRCDSSPSDI